jgi:hypothetical protein
MASLGYFVHTAWAGTKTGSSVCFVISMAAEAGADFSRLARQQTGGALFLKSSVGWSCSQIAGGQRPTIRVRKPVDADVDVEDQPGGEPQKGQ